MGTAVHSWKLSGSVQLMSDTCDRANRLSHQLIVGRSRVPTFGLKYMTQYRKRADIFQ